MQFVAFKSTTKDKVCLIRPTTFALLLVALSPYEICLVPNGEPLGEKPVKITSDTISSLLPIVKRLIKFLEKNSPQHCVAVRDLKHLVKRIPKFGDCRVTQFEAHL